jgi:alkanesulfonate monooxygenase SsuD/methylene tetrahydromethanopterin reductase-like flavin-dependent oxidoreductase (luciferase family)
VVTLSAIFTPDRPPEQIIPVAAAAEAAGMTHLWVWEDCFKESGIATATAMLAATRRLTVGIGLLPVPLRNVALTAMELATMSRLFPGRVMPGIGHGVLGWMSQVGARGESPLTLLREYATALYALLHGETVTTRGRYVRLDGVRLDWPPAVPPPLLVGGVKPRTVALAGELADGVIVSSGPSPAEIRATAGRFRASRPDGAAAGDVVVFLSASENSPPREIAALVSEYAAAGATHVAVSARENDADLERFVTLLARKAGPLVSAGG